MNCTEFCEDMFVFLMEVVMSVNLENMKFHESDFAGKDAGSSE